MNSEDDNGRSDEYWMGVRDALRMVDSFNKWSKRNPGRAKDLEDFIHDGLIAAAKRCESCLRDKMGISFTSDEEDVEAARDEFRKEEDEDDDDDDDDKVVLEEIPVVEDEPIITEPSFEEPISYVEPEPLTPPSEGSDDVSITLDSVERRDGEEMEDLSIEGPPREFTTDFELVEPTPLVVDAEGSVSEPESEPKPELAPEPEPEEVVSGPPEEENEELPDKPAFTWSEYEEAVSPSSEPEPLDPEVDIVPSEDETVSIDEPEEVAEEPPEPPAVWSSHDEHSVVEHDETDEAEVAESEPDETEEDEPVISEPPAPPPPPESEEDEEERKRRARRLFFGA